jgi:hypothetical protein
VYSPGFLAGAAYVEQTGAPILIFLAERDATAHTDPKAVARLARGVALQD